MIIGIEIKTPKLIAKFLHAWDCFKAGWKLYDKRKYSRNLTTEEARELFNERYKALYPEAKEKNKMAKTILNNTKTGMYITGPFGNGAIR